MPSPAATALADEDSGSFGVVLVMKSTEDRDGDKTERPSGDGTPPIATIIMREKTDPGQAVTH